MGIIMGIIPFVLLMVAGIASWYARYGSFGGSNKSREIAAQVAVVAFLFVIIGMLLGTYP
jgi:hypothetical protein